MVTVWIFHKLCSLCEETLRVLVVTLRMERRHDQGIVREVQSLCLKILSFWVVDCHCNIQFRVDYYRIRTNNVVEQ